MKPIMNAIVVNNLTTTTKIKLLDNVTFNVPTGSLTSFIGANGAGKTTTIKSILGLRPLLDGVITINGINAKFVESRDLISYVPEKENFYGLTAMDFLKEQAEYTLPSIANNKSTKENKLTLKNELEMRIINLCNHFKFPLNKLHINLKMLSSGLKKIIMIINAFVSNKPIVIMDEPTEYLDPNTRTLFYKLVNKELKNGKTFFISTHNLDEIQQYTTYIVIIENGVIHYQGPWTYSFNTLRENYDLFRSTGSVSHFIHPTKNDSSSATLLNQLLKSKKITKMQYDQLMKKISNKA